MKLCKDCKWWNRGHAVEFDKCGRPTNHATVPDPVRGEEPEKPVVWCDMERKFYGECGLDGKFWEARA